MSTKHKLICRDCGSEHVLVDAYATWDIESQAFVVAATFDSGARCEDCGGECKYDFVAVGGEEVAA